MSHVPVPLCSDSADCFAGLSWRSALKLSHSSVVQADSMSFSAAGVLKNPGRTAVLNRRNRRLQAQDHDRTPNGAGGPVMRAVAGNVALAQPANATLGRSILEHTPRAAAGRQKISGVS